MKKSLLLFLLLFGFVSFSISQTSFETKVSGDGAPIILIPGLASSGDVWKETVAELSKTNACHVLTLPGFAGQPATNFNEGFLPKIKAEIAQYILQLDQPVILIGHSLGGFLSLQVANEHPELISKAIIVDSYPFYSAAMNPIATVEIMIPVAKQTKSMIENASGEDFETQQAASMPIMTATAGRIPQLVDWSVKSDRSTLGQAIYELMTTDYRPNLSSLKTSVLILGAWYSGKDYGMTAESVKANFEQQYRLAENVQIEMAPTAHHFIMWDNYEWFMSQIQNFIK
ncbi:alpha/beta fold hydrolase [Algoriphagus sp. Y33]|uniref:alpha/beta fold hydrolase n=1 Tax=Algoriphagus sp. Y33 TaxID=2772483 RepID=UPI00177D216B|nr:alpha/beta hydrolase [Algoriphagus sp. Y33]